MDVPGTIICSVPRCERSILTRCNKSSCCSTKMYEGLSQITDWLDAQSITYVVLAGTLLGAHRDQDIIPWTSDLDIGIFQNDSEKVFEQHAIPFNFVSSCPARGCEARVTESDQEIVSVKISGFPGSSVLQGYYIDFYLIDDSERGGSIHEESLASSGGGNRERLRRTNVTIRGKQFWAPADVEGYLDCHYKMNWKVPDPQHKGGGR